MNTKLTSQEINIIRHTVGLDNKPDQKEDFYRNRFIASENHSDYSTLKSLVEKGFMDSCDPGDLTGGDKLFYLTDKGLQIAKKLHANLFTIQGTIPLNID